MEALFSRKVVFQITPPGTRHNETRKKTNAKLQKLVRKTKNDQWPEVKVRKTKNELLAKVKVRKTKNKLLARIKS